MGVTRTGPYSWRITTDEKHVIVVDSILVSSEWEKSAAYAGQKVYFIIDTAFVGQGSSVTVTLKTESGQTLDSKIVKILNNHHLGFFQLPRTIEAEERIYFEVASSPLKFDGCSGSIPVFTEPYVDSLAWSESEVAGGDIVTVTANVYNVADHTPAKITFYEFSNQGAHDPIISITKEVLSSKIEMMWQYRSLHNKHYIELRQLFKEYGKEWSQPKLFFTVTIGSTEYGKEGQDSGFVDIFVENSIVAHVLEFEDVLFYHSSAVVLPDRTGAKLSSGNQEQEKSTGLGAISTVLRFASANKEKKLLLAGHTERSGGEDINFEISKERSLSILYIIENDRSAWANLSNSRYTVHDIQHLLTWAGYDPGPIDGTMTQLTQHALEAFQNDRGLSVTGNMDTETFGAFFDLYQTSISSILNNRNGKIALDNRQNLNWAYADAKSVGCGSLFPKESFEDNGLKSQTNSRVEALFFDAEEVPGKVCKDGSCAKDSCQIYRKRLFRREYIQPDEISAPTEDLKEVNGWWVSEISIETQSADVPDTMYSTIIPIEDALFNHNSAVLLPEGAFYRQNALDAQKATNGLFALMKVFLYADDMNDFRGCLVAGHTDTSGGYYYNAKLSEMRATATASLLRGDDFSRNAWKALFRRPSNNGVRTHISGKTSKKY